MKEDTLKVACDMLNNEHYIEAIDFALNGLKDEPENTNLLLILGKGYFKMQKFGEAKNIFNKVLNIDHQEQEARVYLDLIDHIISITRNYYFENTYTDDQLYE